MNIAGLPIDDMSVQEKLMAMEKLWESLSKNEDQIPVPEWHKKILDERQRQIESGEAVFIDLETAKARIRDRIS
jgi:hypothetical protein